MDNTIGVRQRRLLSRLLSAFGAFTLISSILGGFMLGALTVDLGAFILIWLAVLLYRGSTRAVKWLIVLMIYYAAVALSLTILCIAAPGTVSLAVRSFQPKDLPYVLPFLSVASLWAIVCLAFLWKHRASLSVPPDNPQDTTQGLPPSGPPCGHEG